MNLQHHFLIAMPSMQDPRFEHAVVYICEHNENGAMGLVINKPLEELSVKEVLHKLDIDPTDPISFRHLDCSVFDGGPLADDRGFILHTPQNQYESSIQITDSTVVTTSKDILETLGSELEPDNILIALGYSAWEQGQLEREIMQNDWLTVEASNHIIFETPVTERWESAAKMLGININTISLNMGHA